MKKTALLFLMIGLGFQTYALCAEGSTDSPSSAGPASEKTVAVSSEPAPATLAQTSDVLPLPAISAPVPATPAVTVSAPAPVAVQTATAGTANPALAVSENLEFVSGEIASTDQTAKTVTVKLYGETENAANDKILTIKLDETTDITDGEKDRDIKSLTNGTEVDVEYDPATDKATYIFVY